MGDTAAGDWIFLQSTTEEKKDFLLRLKEIILPEQVSYNEPMSKHTTFRIGGPADLWIEPATVDEIGRIIRLAASFALPVTILGNGSNVLVRDKGIRGLVIKLGARLAEIRYDGNVLYAGAGALLSRVARYAAAQNLTGMEFAAGIPGSVGGATFMNAGAYGGEMANVVTAVTAVTADGRIVRFCGEELAFRYRHSIFQENGSIICGVELKLPSGDTKEIQERMGDLALRRRCKQPVEMPSAGSTFKRPTGYYAGTLIDQAGLKGLRVGGAQVSEKHAGFIVNTGEATAEDVLNLIAEVQRRVKEQSGVMLYPEVKVIGEP